MFQGQNFYYYRVNTSSKKMRKKIIFKRDRKCIKRPFHLKVGVFMIYGPRYIKIEPMEFETVDTELTAIIEPPTKNFLTPKFREDEVNELPVKKEQRLWLELLNRSYNHPIKIKKNCVLGFFIIDNKI